MASIGTAGNSRPAGDTSRSSSRRESATGDTNSSSSLSSTDTPDSSSSPLQSQSSFDQLGRQPTAFDLLRGQTYLGQEQTGPFSQTSPGDDQRHSSDDGLPSGPKSSSAARGTDSEAVTSRDNQIDSWLSDHALERDFLDAGGGERVADAFNGNSELGTLTVEETRYLATNALSIWQGQGNTEYVTEAGENISSPETRSIVASVFAQPSATRFENAGGQQPRELSPIDQSALETAVNMDAAAVVNAHEGHEGALGSTLGDMRGYNGMLLRKQVLESVSQPSIDPSSEGVGQMVTAIFLKTPPQEFINSNYRQSSSEALASVTVNPDNFTDQTSGAYERELISVTERFDGVLATRDGRELIASDNIQPQLRDWAVTNIATNPAFNSENLRGGWESTTVSQAFAAPVMQQYQGRGLEPETLTGEALRNSIGQSMGIAPDNLPSESETPQQEQDRLAAGFEHQYYGPNARIDAIASKITELGGPDATVTIMPVVVTSNEYGAASFNVYKVESENGTHYIEDIDPSRSYDGFSDWQDNSRLPPGKMTYAEGLDWNGGEASLITENTAAVTDTFGEWARKVGDGAALAVGVGVGVAIVVGSGGTALLVAGAGAGLYTAGRAGEQLYDANAHGQDISDLSDGNIRSLWLDAAAGTLSFGAMGAARGASKLVGAGSRLATTATNTAAGLQLGANVADIAAGSNQAVTLASNWDNLSAGDRALGMLNVAFWGGMTAASATAGGGTLSDGYSFTRLRNNIEFGTPYPRIRNDELQSGQMRVAYDTGSNGRASNIRIEHGGGSSDTALVDLHVQAARQVESSGGLRDRLQSLVSNDQPLPIGSAGWEAHLEINKIDGEKTLVRQALSAPSTTPEQAQSLQHRLDELDAADLEQHSRLDVLGERGLGFIASPSTGTMQARGMGWPEPPDGHVWVAGASEPHLRRTDTSGDRLYYDETSGDFANVDGVREIQHISNGQNEVTWSSNADGQTIQVKGTLREFYRYAERSSAETSAQTNTGRMGLAGDDGGHIIGHRFVLNEGIKNMIPQNANLNRSAYSTMENELADWIAAGAEVNIDVKLSGYVDGRPQNIRITYDVVDPERGVVVHENRVSFNNSSGQVFERLDAADMPESLRIGRL